MLQFFILLCIILIATISNCLIGLFVIQNLDVLINQFDLE